MCTRARYRTCASHSTTNVWRLARNTLTLLDCTAFSVFTFCVRDQGVYEAIAVNKSGESRQRCIGQLAAHPRITQLPEETTAILHGQTRFEVRVLGSPLPQIRWFHNWQPLLHSYKYRILWKEPDTSILLVNDTTLLDAGLFTVCAYNIAGSTSVSVTLHIETDEATYKYLAYTSNRTVTPLTHRRLEDDYVVGDVIGRGTQSTVYHVIERVNGRSFAAKVMCGGEDDIYWMNSELWLMNQLHDRQIIRLYSAYASDTPPGGSAHTHTGAQLTLVQELAAGGDIMAALCEQKFYTESDVANVVRQVLWGIQHMHNRNIAHLGLTIGDVLVCRPGGEEIKITDFSLSRHINQQKPFRLDYGIPEFVAPEIVNGESVDLSADLWAVGIITFILLSGQSPFRGSTDFETLTNIQNGEMTFDKQTLDSVSDKAKDFIAKLLVFSPTERYTVTQALKHQWIKFSDLAPPNISIISTNRLQEYANYYNEWYKSSACRHYYRRVTLSECLERKLSRMFVESLRRYTPPPSRAQPALRAVKEAGFPHAAEQEGDGLDSGELGVRLSPMSVSKFDVLIADMDNKYQNGPGTLLMTPNNIGLASRVREYTKLACERSQYMNDNLATHNPTLVQERRKYVDVLIENELTRQKKQEMLSDNIKYFIPEKYFTINANEIMVDNEQSNQMPFFRQKPLRHISASVGQCLNITALIHGNPTPTVQVFKNDMVLVESDRIKTCMCSDGTFSLCISSLFAFDQGPYRAVARNSIGQVSHSWNIHISDVPPRPDMPNVADVSDTQVLLRWNVEPVCRVISVVSYTVLVSETGSSVWTRHDHVTSDFLLVEHLQCDTSYQFRLQLWSACGHSAPSVATPPCRTRVKGSKKRINLSKLERAVMDIWAAGGVDRVTDTRESLHCSSMQLSACNRPSVFATEIDSFDTTYDFISRIHSGMFSTILHCLDKQKHVLRVAKIHTLTNETSSAIFAEFESLRTLCHDNIVCLHEAFIYKTYFILFMECLDPVNIVEYFSSCHLYNENHLCEALLQILNALQYLHWMHFVYLNLQPDNIILASKRQFCFKLIDFGSVRRTSQLGRMTRVEDGIYYNAPEQLVNEPLHPETDVWALGCLLFVLLSGANPFEEETIAVSVCSDPKFCCASRLQSHNERAHANVVHVRPQYTLIHREASQEARMFLADIFMRSPSKRMNVNKCLEHKWLSNCRTMQNNRERCVFLGNRLKGYCDLYKQLKMRQTSHHLNKLDSTIFEQIDN